MALCSQQMYSTYIQWDCVS